MSYTKLPLTTIGFAALLAVGTLAAPGVAHADSPWGSVGTTGAVDEACYPSIRLNSFDARLAPGNTLLTCIIRYQVIDTYGTPTGRVTGLRLESHLLDNGPYARVEVRLRSYNLGTGAALTLAGINSDVTPNPVNLPSGYRYFYNPTCLNLDFNRFNYWVEVTLVRLASPLTVPQGTPAIAWVGLRGCLI